MDCFWRCIAGNFRSRDLKGYLLLQGAVLWTLVIVSWAGFPEANRYSIWTHSFSYLGSYEPCYNPEWWWVFLIAMVFWGFSTVPLVLYTYRRFAMISRWAARSGARMLLLSCVAIVLVGACPTGHGRAFGTWDWGRVHRCAGLMMAIAFTWSIFWHELMLFYDRFTRKRFGEGGYWRFVWPYTLWWAMVFTTAYFQTAWVFVYEDMKKEAEVTGRVLEGAWTEAMSTIYSFPLWETLMITTLYVFLVWFFLVLPRDIPGTTPVEEPVKPA